MKAVRWLNEAMEGPVSLPTVPLTEWYVNKAEGLEKGFTIAAPTGARAEGARGCGWRRRCRVTCAASWGRRYDIALQHANGKMALR
jgi:hypothetical protein